MEIEILKEKDYALYDEFVSQNDDAFYVHSLDVMDLVKKHFKFSPCYIIAKKDGIIIGALPLFKAKSIIEGTRFVSIPFFPFGGVIGEGKNEILDKSKEVSSTGKYLEIRQRGEIFSSDFVKQSPIIDFILPLKDSEDEMLSSLDKRVRYDIRKAKKNNLEVKLGKVELLEDFYNVYLHTKKMRGVPAWPFGLFKEAINMDTLIGVTYLEGKPIAAAFFFMHGKEIEYGFGGANYKYTSLCPYYILLWEVIRYGIDRKFEVLDFGGTTKEINEGNLYAFKERWCPIKKEIPYYFYAKNKKNIPSMESSFGLYRIYAKVWRLLPIPVIKAISPFIIRQFK
jgi:serine/alanine adding enzyme